MYLFTYLSKMKIIHSKVDKTYNNANELFKLFIIETINFLNLRNAYDTHAYFIVVFNINKKFRFDIKKILSKDFHFDRIYIKIQKQIQKIANDEKETQTMYQSYRLNSNNE